MVPGYINDHSNPYTDIIFNFIKVNDYNKLTTLLLNEGKKVNLLEMKDVKMFTVLAFASYKNTEECLTLLYTHALENNLREEAGSTVEEKKKTLSLWVNAPTDEGFTAIHFGTYHGNYAILKFLTEVAMANINVKNKFGSTVLHVAA